MDASIERGRSKRANDRERARKRNEKRGDLWGVGGLATTIPGANAEMKADPALWEAQLERARKWARSNSEHKKALTRNRRALICAAEGTHTKADVQGIFDAQSGKCSICRTSIKLGYHVDHIVPLAKGGSNSKRNLQLLCAPCNMTKSAKDPLEYMRSLGRLL